MEGGIEGRRSMEGRYWGEAVNGRAVLGGGGQWRGGIGGGGQWRGGIVPPMGCS